MHGDLIERTPRGLYCAAGDFYIDPWQPVDRAVITHAHADHARTGHQRYLAADDSLVVLKSRLGDIDIAGLAYGESLRMGDARVSLHPAGHVLGSAQVRVEVAGEVWVVSGDYKLDADPTCAAFEPVRCHTFITESTFGLPIYRWRTPAQMFGEVNDWWRQNAEQGRTSVLYAYAFGKAQRILKSVDPSIGPLVCHGAVERLNHAYRESGVDLPATVTVGDDGGRSKADIQWARALVLAPPSAQGTPWLRRFGEYSDAFASGWMTIRGARRQRSVDRGLVISDHADWPGLHTAILATGATRIRVTHGNTAIMVRALQDQGLDAASLVTDFVGEAGGEEPT
jgi:putative mRNA 3-end processing factor